MRGQSITIVEILSRRLMDICCVQESRWRDESVPKIVRVKFLLKFFWKGDHSSSGNVGC